MEPRFADEYSDRKVEAAKRALVDVMQVLASYDDCLVLVGGWVPELLIPDAEVPHVGSIDVDLALDTSKLMDGRYAMMFQLLLETRRYKKGYHHFQLQTTIDLNDGHESIVVDIDFLAAKDAETEKNKPKLLEGFRLLKADGCAAAFYEPTRHEITGQMANGANNTVRIQVASIPDFLVMKAAALMKRDKPKDAYDICYCLQNFAGGIPELAAAWKKRLASHQEDVKVATEYLREKFKSAKDYGPQQVVAFYNSSDQEEKEIQAQRAYQLVSTFLEKVDAA